MNPNLIKVFKTSNPDHPLYADQKQINENPSLVKWDQRDAWLKAQSKESKPAANAVEQDSEPETDPEKILAHAKANPNAKAKRVDGEPTEPEPIQPRTKADLYALLDDKGIPYTKRMNIAQLEELLK